MKLYYFRDPEGNFGDDLNPWLLPRLLGPAFFDDDADTLFVGMGTLLNHRIPKAGRTVVFGAGYGYGELPVIDPSWQFLCVRGPGTAAKLGLPPDVAVTDPAILVATVDTGSGPRNAVGYMPHVDSARYGDWAQVCALAGLAYIDPRWPVERVFAALHHCRLLVTEAMHGAICADALRLPWIPVSAYAHIAGFKWQDWGDTLGLRYAPHRLPTLWRGDAGKPAVERAKNSFKRALFAAGLGRPGWTRPLPAASPRRVVEAAATALARIAREGAPQLSPDSQFELRLAQMQERLAQAAALKPR